MGFMGNAAVTMRIMPETAEAFGEMKQAILSVLKPAKAEESEIGFGLKALRVVFVVPDGEGGADRLEEMARGVKGVGQVDVESMDRL